MILNIKLRIATFINAIFTFLTIAFPALWFIFDKSDVLVRIIFLLLLSLTFIGHIKFKPNIANILPISFLIFLIISHFWHLHTIPLDIFHGRFPYKYLYFFCFFLILSYGVTNYSEANPFWILISSGIGLSFFIILKIPMSDWQLAWQGGRASFGLKNAQHASVVFTIGLLILIFFGHRLLNVYQGLAKKIVIAWMLSLFIAMFWIMISTQVRAVWLGLTLSGLVSLILYAVLFSRQLKLMLKQSKLRIVKVVTIIITSCVIIHFSLDPAQRIEHRISDESITINSIENAIEFKQPKLTSSNTRITSWVASIDWISERPWLGWGLHSVKGLMRHDARFKSAEWDAFGHLHNSYLESIVATGITGALWMAMFILLVYYRTLNTWKKQALPNDVFIFSWAFFTFWLTVNCFESYINYTYGFYTMSVVGAFIFSFTIKKKSEDKYF